MPPLIPAKNPLEMAARPPLEAGKSRFPFPRRRFSHATSQESRAASRSTSGPVMPCGRRSAPRSRSDRSVPERPHKACRVLGADRLLQVQVPPLQLFAVHIDALRFLLPGQAFSLLLLQTFSSLFVSRKKGRSFHRPGRLRARSLTSAARLLAGRSFGWPRRWRAAYPSSSKKLPIFLNFW